MATIANPGPVPKEALDYFRAKGWKVSFDHRDAWRVDHAVAFTVAKATTIDVLQSVRGAVDQALANGKTFEQFRKELTPTLQTLGWWGRKKQQDPLTGAVREVQLGSPRRLRTIYQTNLRNARAAGQWERIQRTKQRRPYLVYLLGPSHHHRDQHVAWSQRILPADDPFWQAHMPPNGWGCQCHVRQITRREADRLGGPSPSPQIQRKEWLNKRTGEVTQVPVGIDPGFDYNPGIARYRAFTPPPAGGLPRSFPAGVAKPAPLPPTPVSADRLLADGLSDREYIDAFKAEFNGPLQVDPTGAVLPITDDLFRAGDGGIKVAKGDRQRYLRLLADTIQAPDEIWLRWEERRRSPGTWLLKRRYLKSFVLNGQEFGLAAFEWGADGWRGSTVFRPNAPSAQRRERYIERQRDGLLLYRRDDAQKG